MKRSRIRPTSSRAFRGIDAFAVCLVAIFLLLSLLKFRNDSPSRMARVTLDQFRGGTASPESFWPSPIDDLERTGRIRPKTAALSEDR
jgi:hypothetical protein